MIENYSASIEVSATPDASFDAVATQMDHWWSETTEGELNKVGDTVTVIFPPDFGYWTFEASILERGSVLEMVCIDARHHVEGQPIEIDREWVGTRIEWRFVRRGDKTQVSLTHHGLSPQLKCWEICQDGWNYFFMHSLRRFLNGDGASPHRDV